MNRQNDQLELFSDDKGQTLTEWVGAPAINWSLRSAQCPMVVARCLSRVNEEISKITPWENLKIDSWDPWTQIIEAEKWFGLFSTDELDTRAVAWPWSSASVDDWLTENWFPSKSEKILEDQFVVAALLRLSTRWANPWIPTIISWKWTDNAGSDNQVDGFRLSNKEGRLFIIPEWLDWFNNDMLQFWVARESWCLVILRDKNNPYREVFIAHIDPEDPNIFEKARVLQECYNKDISQKKWYELWYVDVPNIDIEMWLWWVNELQGKIVLSKIVLEKYYKIMQATWGAKLTMNKEWAKAQAFARMNVHVLSASSYEQPKRKYNVRFNKPFVCWFSDIRIPNHPIIVFPITNEAIKN